MYNRIQIREIIAWMTLAIAIILFSVTIAFAQTKTISVEKEKGKVHLKITKTENGETIKIDTTFDASDDSNVDAIIESLSNSDGTESTSRTRIKSKTNDSDRKRMHITVDSDFPYLTESQKEELHKEWKESMKSMRKGIEEMKESLKDMHIYVDVDSDSNATSHFHFDFNLPDEEGGEHSNCDGYSYTYKFSQSDDDEIDDLKDKDHVIIIGTDDENPPVLEKVISSKNGKQVFVYKRSGNSKGSGKSENEKEHEVKKSNKLDIHNLTYYPNPTNGKFKLSFRNDKSGDLTIQILDNNSKEVYSEKLNDFDGEYSKEIDLGNISKGNYFLKISQGEKSLTKKIVVN